MNKLIKTILRLIGSGFRYLIFLGKQNYQDILNKPYNGRIGLVIVLIFLTLILFLKFNIKGWNWKENIS